MRYAVGKEIVEQARDCKHGHACLQEGRCGYGDKCRVEQIDGQNVLFLASKEPFPCPYRLSFGGRLLCVCPVHYALAKLKANDRNSSNRLP